MPSTFISTDYGAGEDTWSVWTTTSTMTTSTSTAIWTGWCENTTAATSTITLAVPSHVVWARWNVQGELLSASGPPRPRVRTAEEIARDDAARLAYQAEQRAAEKARVDAMDRARLLLVSNLSPLQQQQFYKESSFVVEGKNGFRYRIRQGRMGNVDVVNREGIVVDRLCAHPREFVPDFDTMLAQKLMLETDEDAFWRVANKHGVSRPDQRVLQPAH